ncbi:MAG: rRNA maturation RNase YbeY [Burkholderiaceae bacterium]
MAARRALPALALSLRFACSFKDPAAQAALTRHRIARWIRSALLAPGEIGVRFVGAEEGRQLNHDYRGQDHATNVLTFGYETAPVVGADLVLCVPVLEREAAQAGISIESHCAHLLVHGTLHAQGYDHEEEEAASAMEARESALLIGLGYADPYAR